MRIVSRLRWPATIVLAILLIADGIVCFRVLVVGAPQMLYQGEAGNFVPIQFGAADWFVLACGVAVQTILGWIVWKSWRAYR